MIKQLAAVVTLSLVATSACAASPELRGSDRSSAPGQEVEVSAVQTGTIEMNGEPFGANPGAEPHLACPIELGYDGFAHGTRATVFFDLLSPTQNGYIVPYGFLQGDVGGKADGDNEPGLDASMPFRFAFPDVVPDSSQGVRLNVTVEVTGPHGTVEQQKAIWVQSCPPIPLSDDDFPVAPVGASSS